MSATKLNSDSWFSADYQFLSNIAYLFRNEWNGEKPFTDE